MNKDKAVVMSPKKSARSVQPGSWRHDLTFQGPGCKSWPFGSGGLFARLSWYRLILVLWSAKEERFKIKHSTWSEIGDTRERSLFVSCKAVKGCLPTMAIATAARITKLKDLVQHKMHRGNDASRTCTASICNKAQQTLTVSG